MTLPEFSEVGLGGAPMTRRCVFGLALVVWVATSITTLAPNAILRNKRLPSDLIAVAWPVGMTWAVVDGFFK